MRSSLAHGIRSTAIDVDGDHVEVNVTSTAIASGATLIHLEDHIRSQTSDPHTQIIDYFNIITGAGIGTILASTQDEFHRPSVTVARVRVERDGKVCKIREKSLKVVAEVPAVAVVSAELHRMRVDVQEPAAVEKGSQW